jgi:hypothetical protein
VHELCQVVTDFDNVKFSNNSIDLQALREFCEREGEAVSYRKGDQMEREGDPSRWFGYVTDGCCYVVVPASCITLPCRTSPLFSASRPIT